MERPLGIRGLKVRIADTLQEWSERLKDHKTPGSFRQYVDDLFDSINTNLDTSGLMPKSGGAFTGPVLMHEDAQNDLSPTTLKQVRAMLAGLGGGGNNFTEQQIKQWITEQVTQSIPPSIGHLMPKAGGTFTGEVTLHGPATQNNHPTTLQQVRELIAASGGGQAPDLNHLMPKAGGTFTGKIVLSGDADQALEATTLQQVQQLIAGVNVNTDHLMPKAGGTFTGPVLLSRNGEQPLEAVTFQQLQAGLAGIGPADLSTLMPKSGGTFTGEVVLAGDAQKELSPVTLQQMQQAINGIDTSSLMPKAGGTFTGAVTLHADAQEEAEPVTLRQLEAKLRDVGSGNKITTYPYDMNFPTLGIALPGEILGAFIAPREITIPENLEGSAAKCSSSAGTVSESVFELMVDGVVKVKASIPAGQTEGTVSLSVPGSAVVIPKGALVQLRAHATDYDSKISVPVVLIVGTVPVPPNP